jgi:hypothetical protein
MNRTSLKSTILLGVGQTWKVLDKSDLKHKLWSRYLLFLQETKGTTMACSELANFAVPQILSFWHFIKCMA